MAIDTDKDALQRNGVTIASYNRCTSRLRPGEANRYVLNIVKVGIIRASTDSNQNLTTTSSSQQENVDRSIVRFGSKVATKSEPLGSTIVPAIL